MNTPTTTQITEAQVVSFLTEQAKRAGATFGGYGAITFHVLAHTEDAGGRVIQHVHIGAGGLTKQYSSHNIDSAFTAASHETPERVAAAKRAEAARLLAEADSLIPRSVADEIARSEKLTAELGALVVSNQE